MKPLLLLTSILLVISACSDNTTSGSHFVQQKDGHFVIGDSPYYFIGTNYWYGSILGSTGQGGNRERLLKELDFMKENGINNLRVLVGADGDIGKMPALQTAPGVYNDTIFDGLDYLLAEMEKRQMYAVLYLNNSWEWSGGYSQYLSWAGYGTLPSPQADGDRDWGAFLAHAAKYATCDSCKTLFMEHIKHVVTRTNRYTDKKYIDDTAIMSWQVANEPRVFSEEGKPAFVAWIKEVTALIRSLDPNHLISTGNEGSMGCEEDIALFEEIHTDPNVDYLTLHIWPKNWNWIDTEHIISSVDTALSKTDRYLQEHAQIAQKLGKPIVIEEFGFPRDNHRYTLDDPTTARDRYYANIFDKVVESAKHKGPVAGCNFWAWGGSGRPQQEFWKPWDDYLGDPPQEEQGLNSVFDTDSTIGIIREYADQIGQQ